MTSPSNIIIGDAGYINLVPNTTTAQVYTITAAPFDWQDAGVTLTHGPTDTSHLFSTESCSGNTCTVTFNTNVTGAGNSIAALDFSDSTIQLTVSGSNLSSTPPSWKVAPVVGQFMQGGVVFWVGDANNPSAPGYRQALVAAVSDISTTKTWGPTGTSVSDAQHQGLFTDPSGAATGLTNTNAICAVDAGSGTTCKSSGTSYPAAQAAQSYISGGKTDWFLPAIGHPGELDTMYGVKAIINATATATGHGGSDFGTCFGSNNCFYWSSSEYVLNTINAWYVYFNGGDQSGNGKDDQVSVRPVRAFNY